MATSDIRVGLGPAGIPAMRGAGDRGRFLDYVRRAEALGYASLCVGDHLDDRGAPLTLLAAAAPVTERITLATHVLGNEWRNPAVLAQEARTVQVLSDGRLEIGLGLGWLERDFETAGLAMAPFAERLARLRTTVERLRATATPRDLGAPVIVLGGGGSAMLRAAAGLADIVTLNIPLRSSAGLASNTVAQGTHDAFADRLRIVRDAAAEAQRDVSLHVYVHNVHLGPAWREQAAEGASRLGLTEGEYVGSPHVLAGDAGTVAATIRKRRDELGIGYLSISGSHLEEFQPVLALVAESTNRD